MMKSIEQHRNNRGQLSLSDAPTVVLLVGLVFLVMATIAFVGEKYGDAVGSTVANTTTGEALTIPGTVAAATQCNFGGLAVTVATNASGVIVSAGNYTVDATAGTVTNTTADSGNWVLNYTNTNGGVACEVNQDLNTELANNTSIAGIVLTISLVGIVLTVLIGIFLVTRRSGRT